MNNDLGYFGEELLAVAIESGVLALPSVVKAPLAEIPYEDIARVEVKKTRKLLFMTFTEVWVHVGGDQKRMVLSTSGDELGMFHGLKFATFLLSQALIRRPGAEMDSRSAGVLMNSELKGMLLACLEGHGRGLEVGIGDQILDFNSPWFPLSAPEA